MTIIIGAAAHKIKAQWLSPGEGVRAAAKLWFEGGAVFAENERGDKQSAPIDKVEVSSRMPGLPRRITFADGVVIVADDNDFIDTAIGGRGFLYRMEAHWRGIFSSFLAAAFVVWVFMIYALPAATGIVAERVPQSLLEDMTEGAYSQLRENDFLMPSQLPPDDKAKAEGIFGRVIKREGDNADDFRYQLRFHRMPLNIANAFAFPDGMIIVTDSLVSVLTGGELEAVIAHEVSHVRRRHGLRLLMESSVVFLLSSFLFGDISFVLSGGAALLVQQKYSRDFEREADCDAYLYLQENGESGQAMVAALTKLEAEYEKIEYAAKEKDDKDTDNKDADDENENDKNNKSEKADNAEEEETATKKAIGYAFELLSSHPVTRERIDFDTHCAIMRENFDDD